MLLPPVALSVSTSISPDPKLNIKPIGSTPLLHAGGISLRVLCSMIAKGINLMHKVSHNSFPDFQLYPMALPSAHACATSSVALIPP
mmetsp:Transcript_17227/g.38139  ORF Transcript_17227/g.38139 Transcript_17227/m.38139 type:complete len:87 (-) Transcript_17227:709-969(-)